jgi:hypothetical protein
MDNIKGLYYDEYQQELYKFIKGKSKAKTDIINQKLNENERTTEQLDKFDITSGIIPINQERNVVVKKAYDRNVIINGKYNKYILYRPFGFKFFVYYSVISDYNLVENKTKNILCLCQDISIPEAVSNYIRSNIIFDNNIYLNHFRVSVIPIVYNENFNKKISIVNRIYKWNFESNEKKNSSKISKISKQEIKYNLIICSLYDEYVNITTENNSKINLTQIIKIDVLSKISDGGNLLLHIGQIIDKTNFEVYSLLKRSFRKVNIFQSKYYPKSDSNPLFIICLGFNSKQKTKINSHNLLIEIQKINDKIYFERKKLFENINSDHSTNVKQITNNDKQLFGITFAKKYNFKITGSLGDITFKMFGQHNNIIYELTQIDKKTEKNKTEKLISIPNNFNKMKRDLIMTDNLIDTRDIDDWYNIKLEVRYYEPKWKYLNLKNYVSRNFNTGTISNAWLKMYEIINYFELFGCKKNDSLKTFHICEAPGNFIASINHYIKTKTDIKKFDWIANSLKPQPGKIAFGDDYGYMKKYPQNWDYGKDNTGNIMNIINFDYYKQKINKNGKVDFITADCGLPMEDIFELYEQENKLVKLQVAMLLLILYCLPKEKHFVAKLILPCNDDIIIYLLYQFNLSFDHLYLFKGVVNTFSKEIYLIGMHYNGIKRNEFRKILGYFNFINNGKIKSQAKRKSEPQAKLKTKSTNNEKIKVDLKNDLKVDFKVDSNFISICSDGLKLFVDQYINIILRQLYFVDNYKNIGYEMKIKIKNDISRKNEEWVKKNNLKKINTEDRL